MPLPTPKENEQREEFVSRCMGDSVMNSEYPEQAQRAAICHSQWEKPKVLFIQAGWKSDPKVDQKQRLVSGMVSTVDVDMVGDVVLPEGMDTHSYFETTKSVDLEHDSNRPVGTCRNITAMPGKGVHTTTYVGRHKLGDDVLTMCEDQTIRGLSIEWDNRTMVAGPPTEDEKKRYGDGCKRVFRKWTLTSYALTARPMNPHCIIDGIKSGFVMEDVWAKCRKLLDAKKIVAESAMALGMPLEFLARTERKWVVCGTQVFRLSRRS